MRISDWSSYVCSSDLLVTINIDERVIAGGPDLDPVDFTKKTTNIRTAHEALRQPHHQASRAPVREVEMEVEPLLHELAGVALEVAPFRSEEHTSELQSLMRISYAVFCLKKKKQKESKS